MDWPEGLGRTGDVSGCTGGSLTKLWFSKGCSFQVPRHGEDYCYAGGITACENWLKIEIHGPIMKDSDTKVCGGAQESVLLKAVPCQMFLMSIWVC